MQWQIPLCRHFAAENDFAAEKATKSPAIKVGLFATYLFGFFSEHALHTIDRSVAYQSF